MSPRAIDGIVAREMALGGHLDYEAIGFRCGLEIHQQLDTAKMHCDCPSEVIDPDRVAELTVAQFDRRLRATQSELGDVDIAARAEARRRRSFRYLAQRGHACLVELDEEPPHPLNADALDVTLQVAGLVEARPAAEVHVMRKTVIDGSNTSGFQRTALVATGGRIDADGGDVGVWTIAVEEDSARKYEEKDGLVTYTLDRLGIPLIELATAPDVRNPQHAQATARRIGALMRATGRVKRGLGTIRQDLNVSVGVGDRIEIKGCQDLRAVPRVIENECRRQLWLHHVRCELESRGFGPDDIGAPTDVSDIFAASQSKVVARALKSKGRVLVLGLPKWAGLIQGASKDGPRLGREFADHAKVAAGVRGVFHSDELPAYGIEIAEVEGVRKMLGLGPKDAFVLCVEKASVARRALEAVAERAVQAVVGVPREVRAAQPDDTTRFMRPLPGAARMYPETDIPPSRIGPERWADILGRLPERPEAKEARFVQTHGVSAEIAAQLIREGEDSAFEGLVAAGADASLAARALLQFLPEREQPDRLRPRLGDVFAALAAGSFAKEALPAILEVLDKEPTLPVAQAVDAAGAGAADASVVDEVVARVTGERREFIRERGMAALGPLMGPVMAELRGKADGQVISQRLKAAIDALLKE